MLRHILDNPFLYLPGKTWQYAKGKRSILILFIIFFVFANLLVLAEPLLVGYILSQIQEQGIHPENATSLIGLLSWIIIFKFGTWMFHGPARVMEMNLAFWIRATYKKFLLDGVLHLPLSWHTDHHSGDTIDRINKGSEALYSFSSSVFLLIEMFTRGIGACIILAFFHLPSLLMIFVSIVLTIATTQFFDKKIVQREKELNRYSNRISAKIFDVISNITTVIVLRAEEVVSTVFWKTLLLPKPTFFSYTIINESKWFLISMYVSITTFLIIASYIWQQTLLTEAIVIGNIYILFQYVGRISEMFFRITYMYGDLIHQSTSIMNSEELSDEFARHPHPPQISMKPWQHIEIRDLAFHYGSMGQEADLELPEVHIYKGERIAFVGESGSGKTTFLKLLRGLYPIQKGSIQLDQQILPDGFANISSHVGLLPQDPELFNTTIEENITFGVEYERDAIMRVMNMAAFTQVAERLPHQLASEIQEKGVNLSGGEKQRLAISRGLLSSQDCEIILLDEPTSSVDGSNELFIYKTIFEEFKEKTIISSIHRLHLLSLFDRIMYFSHGKLIASGTLDEIKATSEDFCLLWKKYHESAQNNPLP